MVDRKRWPTLSQDNSVDEEEGCVYWNEGRRREWLSELMDFIIDPEDEGKQNEEQNYADPNLIIEING